VHEDEVEMYADVVAMLKYANKEEELQAEGGDDGMEKGGVDYLR
jgi:hypothetical protein